MSERLWWEDEAWGARLLDFLSFVASTDGNASADKFITQVVKQNVRYEGRATPIPADFLMEAYKTLGTPSNGKYDIAPDPDSPFAEEERKAADSYFDLWYLYSNAYVAGAAGEERSWALLSSVAWTDEEFCVIAYSIARRFHEGVAQGRALASLTPPQLRALVKEIFSKPDSGNRAPWEYLIYNPHLANLVTSEGTGYYDNFLAGVLDATKASPLAYAYKALIWASWNPNPSKEFLSKAYRACEDPFRGSGVGSTVVWAKTALKEALNPRNLAHYVIPAANVEKALEGEATISHLSAALLLRSDNEESCRKIIAHLMKKQDWKSLTYFTPAIGAFLADLAAEFGDSEGNIPLEWLLEVYS